MRRIYRHYRNNSGFTIVEALFAIAIFGFGILSVITMIDVGFNAGTLSRNMTTCTELAAYMMDRIRFDAMSTTDPFSAELTKLSSFAMDTNSAAPASAPGSTAFAAWQDLVQKNLKNGRGTVTVAQTDSVSLPKHYTVSVTVSWTTVLTRKVELKSVITVL